MRSHKGACCGVNYWTIFGAALSRSRSCRLMVPIAPKRTSWVAARTALIVAGPSHLGNAESSARTTKRIKRKTWTLPRFVNALDFIERRICRKHKPSTTPGNRKGAPP